MSVPAGSGGARGDQHRERVERVLDGALGQRGQQLLRLASAVEDVLTCLVHRGVLAEQVEGQILETVAPAPGEDPLKHYLDVVAGKTGSLIATSARYGALFGGAGPEVERALTAYGEIVGSAFQLSDDILDIASDSHESGKTPGTDLREGVPTLPVLMARTSIDPADARLLELLDSDLTDDARHAEALRLLRAHPALEHARRDTVRYAEEARAALAPLRECEAKAALVQLCDAVVHRAG